MATPIERRLAPKDVRRFGSGRDYQAPPDLTKIQTHSYKAFLQTDVALEKRKLQGIEGVLQEIFPIESYDKKLALSYVRYELGKPRYTPEECRQLRLTYGRLCLAVVNLSSMVPSVSSLANCTEAPVSTL